MPVAASAIYFLNLRGDVLINRLYRDDVGSVTSFSSLPTFPLEIGGVVGPIASRDLTGNAVYLWNLFNVWLNYAVLLPSFLLPESVVEGVRYMRKDMGRIELPI